MSNMNRQSNSMFDSVSHDMFCYICSFLTISDQYSRIVLLARKIHHWFDPNISCRDDVLAIDQTMIDPHWETIDQLGFFPLMDIVSSISIALDSDVNKPTLGNQALSVYIALKLFDGKLKSLSITDYIKGDNSDSTPQPTSLASLVQATQSILADRSILTSAGAASRVSDNPIQVSELHIGIHDMRGHDQDRGLIRLPDILCFFRSSTLTTLSISMDSHVSTRSMQRRRIIEALPSSITNLKISWRRYEKKDQPMWYSVLDNPDFLPRLRCFDVGEIVSGGWLSTVMSQTQQPRPYTELYLCVGDKSVSSAALDCLETLHLRVDFRRSDFDWSCLTDSQSMPHLKHVRVRFQLSRGDGQPWDLNPVLAFLCKRPIVVLHFDLNMKPSDNDWIKLYDETVRGLSELSTLKDFRWSLSRRSVSENFQVSPEHTGIAPFDSEDLSSSLNPACWPNLETLEIYGCRRELHQLEPFFKAAPALRRFSIGFPVSPIRACEIIALLANADHNCPSLQRIHLKYYGEFIPLTRDDMAELDNIHLNFVNLEWINLAALDDQSLHYLLRKMCRSSVSHVHWRYASNDEISKFRLMILELLPCLCTIELSNCLNGSKYLEEYEAMIITITDPETDTAISFPFSSTDRCHVFSNYVNDKGQNGRAAFFDHIRELLSETERKKLNHWYHGRYWDTESKEQEP